ncbi:MAG: hypothetical protein OEU32_07975, partial [Acidimicrobiia bacterium]|nr:hypothetical protein [Acidimicrobiia bacterium]
GGIEFVVHVELCHDACLDRPVPSISEPCDDASLDTAYSRAIERGLPRIVGGEAPDEPTPWYPRLRQFFGQVPATDPLVTAALTAVDAADPVDRPAVCVVELRRLAAEDTMDLQPADGATAWSPAAGDGCIPLAEIAVHLRPEGDSFVVVGDGDAPTSVDNHVRPAHVRTRTIQELLCHAHGLGPPAAGPGDAGDETDLGDASGPRDEFLVGAPRAIAGSAELHGSALLLTFTAPLNRATVNREAFEVCSLRADGWSPVDIDRADLDDSGTVVSLRLGSTPRVRPVRVVANGSGAAPVVGADGRPLVGVTGEAGVAGGRDAALMIAASDDASDDE